MTKDRTERFTKIAEDPVDQQVAKMIRPNKAEKFSKEETLDFMKTESEGFSRLVKRVVKKISKQ